MNSRSLSGPDNNHHNISCLDRTEDKENDKARICIGKTRAIQQKIGPASKLHFNKVLIAGLGQLGLPVAKYVKEKGFDVYGYDICPKAVDRAEKIAEIKKATDFSSFDVYIICVSTHKPEDMFSPHVDGLLDLVDRISKEAKNGALVSIESTIPRYIKEGI